MYYPSRSTAPLKVGLVGTGYVAKLRAEALQADDRAQLLAVVGYTPATTQAFAQTYRAEVLSSWGELVHRPELDLIIVATINRDHGAIAQAALQAGKHVVVEYPLSLNVAEAEKIVALAKAQQKLLHVEHLELLGGVHQAFKQALPAIGTAFYARHATINPQRPAPQKWTYHPDLFGFPLVGALSRLHRLIDAFGPVATVSSQVRYGTGLPPYYSSCICTTQLQFQSGLLAEIIYGKGEQFWQPERKLVVQGQQGAIIFEGDEGMLIRGDTCHPLEVGPRRGMLAKDMILVLDHLFNQQPLYVTPEESLYSLKVADAARHAAQNQQTVHLVDE